MSVKTKFNSALYLLKLYVTSFPRIFYRSTFSLLIDPKGTMNFLHQLLNAQDVERNDPVLITIEITDIFKDSTPIDVKIEGPYYCPNTSEVRSVKELASLAYIIQVLKPHIVFEIGTFIGRTTRLFAINCPDYSQIFTLDLPQESVKHRIGEEFQHLDKKIIKITQLYGDSLAFNFSAWFGKCDFVWVDGCHDYEYVASDTENALKLCRPGGWIAWHDYRHTAWWSGVTRYVREQNSKNHQVYYLRGTTIALLKKN